VASNVDEAQDLGSTLSIVDGRRRPTGQVAPQPHLFLVLECSRPRVAPAARFALHNVDEVIIGRGTARAHARMADGGLRKLVVRVPDPWMSGTHATLTKVFGRWVLEDARSKNGTMLNGEAQARAFLGDGDVIELGHTFFIYRDALPTPADEPHDVDAVQLACMGAGLATLVPALAQTFRRLEQVARSELSVVLSGETGTGKEIVARAVHGLSGRPGAFVAVNCGALPETLVETELFGYRKGAFSGANEDRPGLVRSADHGTLFLDEIGDLPLASQAAFLRVLQEKEVVPVGGTRPVGVDVRLIAATHRDLESLIANEEFRSDLHARISGVKVTLPPLRERREDLGMLAATLLERVGASERVSFDVQAARALFRYSWPMNIRELEKALAAAVVLAGELPIECEHLPPQIPNALVAPPPEESEGTAVEDEPDDDRPLQPEDLRRRDELARLLREHKGNISAVARVMGKARMQIQRWVKRYKLDPESYRR
jgi:sigma-54 dependent transcriptional regulator, acetoin dehydrogenase operon transcriptional activator AcoR